MTENINLKNLTRREVLQQCLLTGAIVVGVGFIAAPNALWALEVKYISEHEAATLLQMARDIYPHDKVGDEFYATAIKAYDDGANSQLVKEGIAKLDKHANALGYKSYLDTKWEANRVELLEEIEKDPFFQTIRAGLVTGLYNQKALWPIFGYEGESFSKGGYIDRGFNDINWL